MDMKISEQENELFDTWKTKYSAFVEDGSPDPLAFQASLIRTVIMLKDVNAPNYQGVFSLRGQLKEAPNQWWRTVANWCAAMLRVPESPTWRELQAMPIKESLKSFAFMQLKKEPGGGSIENWKLREYARRDAVEIDAQLRIYQPKIIVAAGVGQILLETISQASKREFAYRPRFTKRGVRYYEIVDGFLDCHPTYLIQYMHPSARGIKSVACYGLRDAYAEITNLV